MIGPDLEQFAEELSAYLDDELSDDQREIVEEKLRRSEPARRLLEELRTTSRIVSALPRHEAPPSVVENLNAQLERTQLLAGLDSAETVVATKRTGWRRRLSMAAMIAVVTIGGWWIISGPGSPPSGLNRQRLTLLDQHAPRDDLSNLDTPLSPGVTGSSEGREQNKKTLKSADVETKLAAGVPLKALRGHDFANEPIHLEIPVQYESEQAGLLVRLSRKLASADAVDLASDSSGHSPTGAFYYRGHSGLNYKKGSSKQILVRATRKQVDQILKELRTARNGSQVRLRAGAMTLRGLRKASEVLALLVTPDVDRETGAANQTKAEKTYLDDVLVSLGIDPETFHQSGKRRQAGRPPGETVAMAERFDGDLPGVAKSPKRGKTSAKRARKRRAVPNEANRRLALRKDSVANTGIEISGNATAKDDAASAETYVTFVIEIPVTKRVSEPTRSEPNGRKKNAQ